MHLAATRSSRVAERRAGPPFVERAAALMLLTLTPVLGYGLGRVAWEQMPALADRVVGASLLGPTSLTVGEVLTPIAAAAGALVAGYLTLVTVALAATPRRSRVRAAVNALTPRAWRRLVTVATASTVSIALAVPATAAVDVTDAGWVPAPANHHTTTADAASPTTPASSTTPGTSVPSSSLAATAKATDASGATRASAALHDAQDAAQDHSARTVVVAPGDTLWDITAAELKLAASDHAAIAQAWPELHDANRDHIGSDPSLIMPDQVLTIPKEWTS